jgi:hypothetical protein
MSCDVRRARPDGATDAPLMPALARPAAPAAPTGPDPDDIKALLVAATLHNQGNVCLRAVVANGGGAARDRARLARCVLDHVGAEDVPVGVGSDGVQSVPAQPHEYALDGYAAAPDARLRIGAELLVEALAAAPGQSVKVVCISSLRDFADLVAAQPELVRDKVCEVAVQGGLVPDASALAGWAPDTSQNNEFDREAATAVYGWCFAHGMPMTVTSRFAVPYIPMQLARSFAERTECPVMRYLADAQFLGLQGLWRKLCAGTMPARCTKQWYFETFCGVDAAAFAREGLDALGPDVDIVKPYVAPFAQPPSPSPRALTPILSPHLNAIPPGRRHAPSAVRCAGRGPASMLTSHASPAPCRSAPASHPCT